MHITHLHISVFCDWIDGATMRELSVNYECDRKWIHRLIHEIEFSADVQVSRAKKRTREGFALRELLRPYEQTPYKLSDVAKECGQAVAQEFGAIGTRVVANRCASHLLGFECLPETRYWGIQQRTTPELFQMIEDDPRIWGIGARELAAEDHDEVVAIPWRHIHFEFVANPSLKKRLDAWPVKWRDLVKLPFAEIAESPIYNRFKTNAQREGAIITPQYIHPSWNGVARFIRDVPDAVGILPHIIECGEIARIPLKKYCYQTLCVIGQSWILNLNRQKLIDIGVDVDHHLPESVAA